MTVSTLEGTMPPVTIYTADPCGFCRNAKALLARRGVAYEEINLTKDPDGRLELLQKTGMMTFPQIVVDGELLGGFQELAKADAQDRLAGLKDGAEAEAEAA